MSYDDYYDEAMSEAYGSDWEKYICPIAGTAGQDLCFVDRDSEECKKCQAEFEKSLEEHYGTREQQTREES